MNKGMQALTLVVLIPAMIESIIRQIGAPGGDEEDDYVEDMAVNMLDSVIGTKWPIYGSAASNLVIKGKGLESIVPAVRGITSLRRSAVALSQSFQGVDLTPWQIRDLNNAATLITGVPLLSPVTIPLRIGEILETPREKRKRLKTRRKQLRRLRKQEARRNR